MRLLLKIFFFSFVICKTANAQSDSTKVFGKYYLETPFSEMRFEFKNDSTFIFEEFIDVGGWASPAFGNYFMQADTINLIFIGYDDSSSVKSLKGWRLLFDYNRIYHYENPRGIFSKDFPLKRKDD